MKLLSSIKHENVVKSTSPTVPQFMRVAVYDAPEVRTLIIDVAEDGGFDRWVPSIVREELYVKFDATKFKSINIGELVGA
ncbi:Hypothetical predicted protein [Olea europaea subsp. europaea]|uniref:Uncharacterized protein n=1 Tax=Olea europaea subsp. europaea TaxID=158383 RepID=A0A8S0U9G5_OLEEU|nr:Hypothetical predicted protein [Olea europaea subsp. europaea]